MSKRLHFEDNIFFINILIRTIRDGLLLDLDSEYFLVKIMNDIGFIGDSLEKLLDELEKNERLLERQEQLLNLSDCEESYKATLMKIRSGNTIISNSSQTLMDKILVWQERSNARSIRISGLTSGWNQEDTDASAVVSSYELNELLKNEAES